MKKVISLLIILSILTVSLMGCKEKEVSNAGTGEKKIVVGVAMNASDEYRTSWLNAFKVSAEAKGFEVITTDANNSASKQISDVESLITNKPDIILLTPVDPEGSAPAAEAVKNANIPLVIIDIPVLTDKYDVWITTDQGIHGKLAGEYIKEWIAARPGTVANVGYIVGAYIPAVVPRMDMIFTTDPEAVKVAEAEGGWSADKAMKITEDWLQAYPEINVIAAMNDEMAIGAIQALVAAGKNMDDYLIIGVDGTKNGLEYVKTGELDCTTSVDLQATIDKIIEVTEGLVNGKTFDKDIALPAIELVTKDSVGK